MNLEEKKLRLLDYYKRAGIVKSKRVEEAFLRVPREKFVIPRYRDLAYADEPLPILSSQTISAPHMCLIMIEVDVLDLNVGDKVLEVGAGSGYHAALLAEMVQTRVFTIERIPELVEFAKKNLKNTGYGDRVEVVLGDGTNGYAHEAPYDKIMVTAAAPKVPEALIEQLKPGGRIAIPLGGAIFSQRLVLVKKSKTGDVSQRDLMGVAFVPLIGDYGFEE